MTSSKKPVISSPERLAYWYFRLNGFLTTEDFIVHDDAGPNQKTDVDLLAVRFAHRAENLHRPMKDDSKVAACSTFANVIIAEITTTICKLNGPWKNPDSQNMHRVVKSLGCVPDAMTDEACAALYQRGVWSDTSATIRLFAIGETRNAELPIPATQLFWTEIIPFIIKRFKDYSLEKSSVGNWTPDGVRLKECALGSAPEAKIRFAFRLRSQTDVTNGDNQ